MKGAAKFENLVRQFTRLSEKTDPDARVFRAGSLICEWAYELGRWETWEHTARLCLRLSVTNQQRTYFRSQLGGALWQGDKLEEALRYSEEAAAGAARLGLYRTWARSLSNIGAVRRRQERYSEALSCYEEALSVAHAYGVGDDVLVRRLANNLAVAYRQNGDVDNAATQLLLARSLAQRHRDRHGLAMTLINLSQVELDRGNAKRAVKLARRSVAFARAAESRNLELFGVGNLALALIDASEFDLAAAALNDHLRLSSESNDRENLRRNAHNRAWLDYRLGKLEQAEEGMRAVVSARMEANDRLSLATAHEDLAEILVARNAVPAAISELERAIVIVRDVAPAREEALRKRQADITG